MTELTSSEIIVKRGTTNTTYSTGHTRNYIVLHYTAGTSSTKGHARDTATMFGVGDTAGSASYIVDDAEIVQYNDDDNRYCWSVGGTCTYTKTCSLSGTTTYVKNKNSISIEMCSNKTNKKSLKDSDTDWYLTDATVENAARLTRYLMKKYNIPADHVVMHAMVNSKPCPQPWVYKEAWLQNWYNFKKKLVGSDTATTTVASTAKTVNYKVKVTASSTLRCRSEASTSGSIITSYAKGTILTITKELNGWGYANNTGWVYLTYTEAYEEKTEEVDDMTEAEVIKIIKAQVPALIKEAVPELVATQTTDLVDIEDVNKLIAEAMSEHVDIENTGDATDTDWFHPYTEWAKENKLFAGDGNGNYGWNCGMTRAQFATVMKAFYALVQKDITARLADAVADIVAGEDTGAKEE